MDKSPKIFDLEHLIKVVHEERLLWDKRHKNYRNRLMTKRAWKNAAKILGCTEEEAQSKWKNLRDTFSRELRRVTKEQPVADKSGHICEWVHFSALQFLKDVIRPRNARITVRRKTLPEFTDIDDESAVSVISNSTRRSSNTDNQTYIKSELESFPIQFEESGNTEPIDNLLYPEYPDIILQKNSPTSDVSNVVENESIKRNDYTAMLAGLEKQKLHLLKKEMEIQEDEDMNWFKSILPHMRTLPPFNKFLFRTKVQEMLLGELAKLNSSKSEQSAHQNTQSTSSANTSRHLNK